MTISEVARKYDLSADTIRYYERIGLIPRVHRNASGIRDFTESDCGWVEFIKCMRGAGLPIEALIDYVALFQQGDATAAARKAILTEQRDILAGRMAEMQRTLDRLNQKIEHYEEGLRIAEEHLLKRAE